MSGPRCSVAGCELKHQARGYCHRHYYQRRRTGAIDLLPSITLEEKFWRGVGMGACESHMDTPCWLWTRGYFNHGYGQINHAGKRLLAHRIGYEMVVGIIPPKLELDHKCRVRSCVRPDHLRTATKKQNRENLVREGRLGSSSGIRGVYPRPNGKWQAMLGHNGRILYLGTFTTTEAAEAAVTAKRNELFTHNDLDRQ